MRESGASITQLCESWRERLVDATKQEQRAYAQEFLRLMDWEQPIPFSLKEGAESLAALPFLLRAGGQTSVAVFFVPPGLLEPPSSLVERHLDFCIATRTLVDEVQSLNVNYTLVTDLYRSYLYDARTDELLLYADTPTAFKQELLPVLRRDDMERGALEEIRRQPRSFMSRELREWREFWVKTLHTRGHLPEKQAQIVLDRLVVIRFLFRHDILRRTKWRLEQRFMEIVDKANGIAFEGCGEVLVKLFHDMWFDWKIDLFEVLPDVDETLADDTLVAPMLSEFMQLSNAKFNIATVMESFNYGSPQEKLRVRMVPDINEEREHYLARQSLQSIDQARIEIDLMDEGYRAIFHWFEKVVSLYDRLGLDFDAAAQRNAPPPEDLDLFAWSEIDAKRPNACSDKMAHACQHGFGIYHADEHQYRVARLLLTLHLISRYAQTKQAVNAFPDLKPVFMPRPTVLSSNRVMPLHPPIDPYNSPEIYEEA